MTHAISALLESIESALPDQPESVLPVLEHLAEVNGMLGNGGVPPEQFQETRAAVDRALIRVNSLLAGLIEARDDVADALSTFNAKKRAGRQELFADRLSRLDVRT